LSVVFFFKFDFQGNELLYLPVVIFFYPKYNVTPSTGYNAV